MKKRVTKAGLSSTVGFQQVLDNPANYDTLQLAALAQAGELFFKVLGLTLAATSPTDKAVDHVVAEFYKNLFHNYSAALRSNEPEESFITMAPAFVRLILAERLALTRSTYSLGAETSMAALMAALTLIWAIMPDFEKLATTARTTADQSTGGHQTSRYQSGSVGSDRCGYIDGAQPASKQEDLRQEEQLERAAGNTKQVVKPVASKLTQPAKSQVAMMSCYRCVRLVCQPGQLSHAWYNSYTPWGWAVHVPMGRPPGSNDCRYTHCVSFATACTTCSQYPI